MSSYLRTGYSSWSFSNVLSLFSSRNACGYRLNCYTSKRIFHRSERNRHIDIKMNPSEIQNRSSLT